MGRSILLLFEHIAFGGDIALEWKIQKYFGMVTLLLFKAVLGREALPFGAAYYCKFKIPDWITTCCFGSLCNALINYIACLGAAKPWNSTEENDFIDTNICNEILQNELI